MSTVPVRAECCQTCMHWEGRGRKIVDNGNKVEVILDYQKCELCRCLKEWREWCGSYSHPIIMRQAAEEDLALAMDRSGGFLGQAKEILKEGGAIAPQTEQFVRAFSQRDALAMTQLMVPLEKWKRDALIELLESWLELLEQALACRTGGAKAGNLARSLAGSRSSAELMAAVRTLRKALEYCRGNVSTGAVCGWLQWELR